MKDLASAEAKKLDHLAQFICLETLRPYSFALLVRNELVLHPAETTLPTGCVEERRSTCLTARVAET